jgi:hypothetical protein
MRLAASKPHQHLRDLLLKRRLVHAIVGALTYTNDSITARSVYGSRSSGANRMGVISVPRRSSGSSCICHNDTRWQWRASQAPLRTIMSRPHQASWRPQSGYWRARACGSLDDKHRLRQLFFPEGVASDGMRFNRTAPTALPFNLTVIWQHCRSLGEPRRNRIGGDAVRCCSPMNPD